MKSISEYQEEYDRLIFNIRIENRKKKKKSDFNYIYYEKHHILPKCLYPEFKNLRQNPWNSIFLTPEEHFEAHQLLALIYPEQHGLLAAFITMSKNRTIEREEYGELKRKYSDILSKRMKENPKDQKGEKNPMFGRVKEKHHGYKIPRTKEVKQKISLNHRDVSGPKNPRSRIIYISLPNGEIVECFGNFKRFCKKMKLSYSMMNKILKTKKEAKFGRCVGYYCWY